MLRTLQRVLGVGALIVALSMLGLTLVEESGLVTRLVRERLARALGPLGPRLSIERVELRWFEPGLELYGLELAPTGQARASDLRLERVHVSLSRSLTHVRALHVSGGRLLVGPRAAEDWNSLATRGGARGESPELPPGSLRGLELALELGDHSRFELGTLDLCARTGAGGAIELAGALAPAFGGAITAREPIRVSGVFSSTEARLWASARDLALETRALPPAAMTRRLPIQEGSGRLTLDASIELSTTGDARPHGHLRASLRGGRGRLGAGRPAFTDLTCELDASLTGEGEAPLVARDWKGRLRAEARIEDSPVLLWGRLGAEVPGGQDWLELWGRASGVPVDEGKLWEPALEPEVVYMRALLAPRGRVDLAGRIALRNAEAWRIDRAVVRARADGELGLTYLGVPGEERSGLPLPLESGRGEFVGAWHAGAARPWRFAGLGLSATHGSGTAEGWLQLTAPLPESGPKAPPELDLVFSTPSIAVDTALLRALRENRHLDWIEPAFAPENGTLGADFRLRIGPEVGGTSAAGTLTLHGLSLRWSQVPVQMDGVEGTLGLRWSQQPSVLRGRPGEIHRPFGVTYSLDNRAGPHVGAAARVAGWVREESLPATIEALPAPGALLQEIRIDIDELGLRGRDFDVLAGRFPTLEREVSDYGAVGRTRVRFHGAQAALGTAFRSSIEATPIEVHVRPQFFQRQTRDLRGRILIQRSEDEHGELSAAQFLLTGTWPGKVELFTRGIIPESGISDVHVYGAGIDPTNTSFKGALITTLSSGPEAAGVDLSSWTLAGPVDFALETRFDLASPEPARNRFLIQLRDNDFQSDDLVLHDLHGTCEQENDVLRSERIEATLGGHEIELRNLLSFPLAALGRVADADPWLSREGFWSDPGGRALQADVYTRALPLDADHLRGLVDPPTLELFRSNPSWKGVVDVLGARMVVTSEGDNQGKVAVRGAMRPHDLSMSLGLPIRVATARVNLEEFVSESGRNRGWAHIEDLDALIAERELSGASMIAGYVDGRLTIDNLSGDFEGGRFESLGGTAGGVSKALGVDLSEPYRFDVGVRLSDVNVGGLLRGVFQSSIADEGVLDASLQISGTPSEVLALTGRGSLSLDEGALWSIPVMRELFAQLGFDKSGLFDRLRARFELRDGRIRISHLEIRSDILDLVGEGWQDLDGMLSYDLEVRYGLLDKLGLFGRLLYWLNNNLMRVAVRGDFDRPEVTIRNAILELVRRFDKHPPRKLPLPRFSGLGPRF